MVIKMELQKHEVSVENKNGDKLTVSAVHYAQNKGKLKLLDDNGWKDKMDTLNLNDKSSNEPSDTKNKAGDHKGNSDMTEAEMLAMKEKEDKKEK